MTKSVVNYISVTCVLLISAILFAFLTMAAHAQVTALTGSISGNANNSYVDIGIDVNSSTTQDSHDSDLKVEVELEPRKNDEEETVEYRNESSGSLRVNEFGVAIVSSYQVKSESDLEVFKSNIVIEENNVNRVEIYDNGEDEVEFEVIYNHNGRLFGVIPVSMKSTTRVEINSDSEIEIKTKMPWWSFLVAKDSYIDGDLETELENNANIQLQLDTNASASAKAQIIEEMIAEIKAHSNANLNVAAR